MDADILLFVAYMALLGAGIGTFSGLVPGIHVNTLATLMLSFYPILTDLFSSVIPLGYIPVCVASCIVSASVVHSFVDYVPSVYIGAPDPDDCISMLPGHRLLNEGRAMVAVRSAAIGSLVGACAAVAIAIPLQMLLLNGLGDYLDSITVIVLVATILLMGFHEKTLKQCAFAFFLIGLSGLLGIAVMNLEIPCNGLLNEGTLLFPMLTGLFGLPTMLESIKDSKVVEQKDDDKYPVGPVPGIKGVVTGSIIGWFPGITATTGAVMSSTFMPEKKSEGFISMIASIGTASVVLMLVTLSVTGKGRSGTMLVVKDILGDDVIGCMNANFLLLLFSVTVAAFLGYHITISCGKTMASLVSRINMKLLNKFCIVLVIALVLLFTGPFGIGILVISTIIGFLPKYLETSKFHLSGCLIVPTLCTHLGITEAVIAFL